MPPPGPTTHAGRAFVTLEHRPGSRRKRPCVVPRRRRHRHPAAIPRRMAGARSWWSPSKPKTVGTSPRIGPPGPPYMQRATVGLAALEGLNPTTPRERINKPVKYILPTGAESSPFSPASPPGANGEKTACPGFVRKATGHIKSRASTPCPAWSPITYRCTARGGPNYVFCETSQLFRRLFAERSNG